MAKALVTKGGKEDGFDSIRCQSVHQGTLPSKSKAALELKVSLQTTHEVGSRVKNSYGAATNRLEFIRISNLDMGRGSDKIFIHKRWQGA